MKDDTPVLNIVFQHRATSEALPSKALSSMGFKETHTQQVFKNLRLLD